MSCRFKFYSYFLRWNRKLICNCYWTILLCACLIMNINSVHLLILDWTFRPNHLMLCTTLCLWREWGSSSQPRNSTALGYLSSKSQVKYTISTQITGKINTLTAQNHRQNTLYQLKSQVKLTQWLQQLKITGKIHYYNSTLIPSIKKETNRSLQILGLGQRFLGKRYQPITRKLWYLLS